MNKWIAPLLTGVVLATPCAAPLFAQTCDRACLEGFVDQYMEALIAHKPAQLKTARRVKNTEDGVQLELGDGFWRTARGKGTFRLFVTDTEAGQVTFIGTMREDPNLPVIIGIRLKVSGNEISEIENLLVRDAGAATALENRGQADPLFTAAAPQRAARADLIRVANGYLSGIEKNDGKGDYPVAADCMRHQNGFQTTSNPNLAAQQAAAAAAAAPPGRGAPKGGAPKGKGAPKGGAPKAAPAKPAGPQIDIAAMSCLDQFKSGYFNFAQRVRDRRFVAVDRDRSLVTVITSMDAPTGRFNTFRLADGREITAGPDRPTTYSVMEMFKIEGGKIRRAEAVQLTVPYAMLSGWSSYEDGMSSRARDMR